MSRRPSTAGYVSRYVFAYLLARLLHALARFICRGFRLRYF